MLAKRLRRLCRQIRTMYGGDDAAADPVDPVNERVGGVAVLSDSHNSQDMIVLWGGYREHRNQPNFWPSVQQEYWPPEEVLVYNRFECRWKTVETGGQIPPRTSGAAAVAVDGVMYVICGYIKNQEGDEEGHGFAEKNTNTIYSLDFGTWTWEKKTPEGIPPMRLVQVPVPLPFFYCIMPFTNPLYFFLLADVISWPVGDTTAGSFCLVDSA